MSCLLASVIHEVTLSKILNQKLSPVTASLVHDWLFQENSSQ